MILFGFFVGILFIIGSIDQLTDIKRAQLWPSRRGVITHSYVTKKRGHKNRRYWSIEIAGTYVGTSEKFDAGRIGFGAEFSVLTRERGERMAAQYPVKTELDVYYDPEKPSRAILVRGNSPATTQKVLMSGIVLILIPFALYGFGRWRAQSEKAKGPIV